jgi:flavin reductase (DIM6/NTAB) family NADH-FMN oxidoreductase RutF
MSELVDVSSFSRLMHPYVTLLVTCCDAAGSANIITIAWAIPVSGRPPLMALSVAPPRHSFGLIQETGEFVVNVAPFELAEKALYCGRRSGRDVNKFDEAGLTAKPAQHVRPPIIAECIAHLECRVVQDIEAGDHHIFVGEVLAAYARADVLSEGGMYELSKARPLLHVGGKVFTTTTGETIEPSLKE